MTLLDTKCCARQSTMIHVNMVISRGDVLLQLISIYFDQCCATMTKIQLVPHLMQLASVSQYSVHSLYRFRYLLLDCAIDTCISTRWSTYCLSFLFAHSFSKHTTRAPSTSDQFNTLTLAHPTSARYTFAGIVDYYSHETLRTPATTYSKYSSSAAVAFVLLALALSSNRFRSIVSAWLLNSRVCV